MRRPGRPMAAVAGAVVTLTALLASSPTPAGAASTTATRVAPAPASIAEWLTTGDQKSLLAPQPALRFSGAAGAANAQTIAVTDSTKYQALTGFGALISDSSAWLIAQLPSSTRDSLLKSLFGPGGLSVVRVSLGSSDYVVGQHYSYDDLPVGATDPTLAHFSVARDESYLIPLLRAIRAVNPAVRIVASLWSAPGWMKTSGALIGGTLNASAAETYARYLVLALKAYAADGVRIDALTVQNEPEFSPGDYPGMTLTEPQEADLVGHHLGPDLRASGLTTMLLGYDHNWNDWSYPSSLVADKTAGPYLAGVAFHCYLGDVSGQSTFHNNAPGSAVWLTECSGGSWSPGFAADLVWETRNLFVGGTRNWATAVLWSNLALDPSGGPHRGGCTGCRGMVTINAATATVTTNVEYWTLAHASVATRPGAVRVASSTFGNGNLESTAFLNPDGSHALVVVNSGTTPRSLQIQAGSLSTPATLPGGAVATFGW